MQIVAATKNKGKLAEFKRMLEPLGFTVLSSAEAGFTDEVEETGATFAANAAIKARAVCSATGLAAIGDDSGLCVDALDGAPGVFSARYAGERATDDENIEKLLAALKNVPEEGRSARFECAVVAVFPDGRGVKALGQCWGSIGFERLGENGFGYDPVFMVDGKSFSQLTETEKDSISHRGKALRRLLELLEGEKER